mgnify:CR=1 FL=1
MDDYASQQRKPTRHLIGLGLVVVLHLLLFWAISSGLARSVVKKIQGPVEAVLLEEKKPDIPPPPPPPPPKNMPPPPPPAYVPPVDVPVSATSSANAIAAVTATPQPPAPPPPVVVAAPAPPPAAVVRTPAVVNSANCAKPEYPSASRRLEEEGTVSLRFLVGTDGKVIESEVEKSSGYKRLDEAARAALSRCQFRAATVDGKPEQGWATMKYTWRLE